MKILFRKLIIVVSSGFLAIFGFAYYHQYFKWRDCFNDLGRCYDSDTATVYLEQSGIVWLSLALIAAAVGFFHIWRLKVAKL